MNMIAKFKVTSVMPWQSPDPKTGEPMPMIGMDLEFMAVTDKPFSAEGESDDNSFARWMPSGTLKMSVTNPALFGKFERDQKYYLTFTEAMA